MTIQEKLKRTPLYEEHTSLNAKMVSFGGWEMPVQYEGILSEHKHTREAAALFDISHMGEFFLEGDLLGSGLDNLVTMSLNDLPIGSCRYGTMLNDQAGIIDDLIIFRLEDKKWFIVVNAATKDKDLKHIKEHLSSTDNIKDLTLEIGKLDIQGPLSREVLSSFVDDLEKLDYYTFDYFDLLGENVIISRTGYTGELGYEIYYPWDKLKVLWKKLLSDARVKPAGLGARDILRLEVGYSLYGHELDESISPIEAGLNRFVDFNKEFIGKSSLIKQKEEGLKRKILGFLSSNRRSPRQNNKIYSSDEKEIGYVTSGTFSPSLNRGIGLGFISQKYTSDENKIYFGDQKNKTPAEITSRMFYKNGSLKS